MKGNEVRGGVEAMEAGNTPPGTDLAIAKAYEDESSMTIREAIRRYPKAIAWTIGMSMTVVMVSYDGALIASVMAYPSFVSKYGTYDAKLGEKVITAPWQVALGIASLTSSVPCFFFDGYLVDHFGHRIVTMVSLILTTGLIFIVFFAPNIQVILVSQILLGLTWSIPGVLGPAYASEICPTALRGYLTSFPSICWNIGQLINFAVLEGLVDVRSIWGFKIPFALEWMFPLPIFLIVLMAPDSPWWLVRQGRMEDAKRSLRLLGDLSDAEINDKVLMMHHTNQLEKKVQANVSVWDCFKGSNLRRTEIACLAFASQPLVGQAVGFNPSYFFVQAGLSPSNAYKLTFGASAISFVAICFSWAVISWMGNRRAITIGLAMLSLIMLLIGILSYARDQHAASWGQSGLIILWSAVFSAFVAPEALVIASEISATRLRSQTLSLANLTYNTAGIIELIAQPYLINPTQGNLKGKSALVWFVVSALVAIWAIFRIPETWGRTFAEIDILFEKKVSAWRFPSEKVDIFVETETERETMETLGVVGEAEKQHGELKK